MSEQIPAGKYKWDARYRKPGYEPNRDPLPYLAHVVASTRPGRAICLACGTGRNAVYLAECGFDVTGVDVSPRGLELCRELAAERGVTLTLVEADLQEYAIEEEGFDLVTSLYYYEPLLFPSIREGLKPGGLFLLHTFSVEQLKQGWGASTDRHLARVEPVREAFGDWDIRCLEDTVLARHGRDEGLSEAVIRLLAQKPQSTAQ